MNDIKAREKWGNWVLSDGTLNTLKNEEAVDDGVVCNKYVLLVEEINMMKREEVYDMSVLLTDLMSDYLPFDLCCSRKKSAFIPHTKGDQKVNDLVQQLINNVKGNVENVQEVIELVSNTPNEILSNILSDVWEQLTAEEEKEKFIKLISACTTSSHLFCKNILLNKLKDENCFHSTVEIVYTAASRLESHIVADTILPLLKDSTSILVRDPQYLKHCMDSFSNCQKSDVISGYIDMMESRLERHHLLVLETILENILLNPSSISKLIDLLSTGIMEYSEDRSFGKILLLIADNITPDISKDVLSEFNLVCNNFKGTLRFRIKAAVKKKTNL